LIGLTIVFGSKVENGGLADPPACFSLRPIRHNHCPGTARPSENGAMGGLIVPAIM
jgi:hypothetical protein